jgi:hypothetical protein
MTPSNHSFQFNIIPTLTPSSYQVPAKLASIESRALSCNDEVITHLAAWYSVNPRVMRDRFL